MKKVSKVIITMLLITITLSTIHFILKKDSKILEDENKKESKFLTYMLETDIGSNKFEAKTNVNLPLEGYHINVSKSGCENGGTLSWNSEKQRIETNLLTSDKCYVYLDNVQVKSEFDYTGNYEEYVVPSTGTYKIELWGASGGMESSKTKGKPGLGGYTSGTIFLTKGTSLYVYVGEQGAGGIVGKGLLNKPSFNGGGAGIGALDENDAGGSGGGATDVRLENGEWDNFVSLKSRIIVAGGGAGASDIGQNVISAGSGGGLTGVGTSWHYPHVEFDARFNATQTTGNKFGVGGNGLANGTGGSGGGGGYYGGLADNDSSKYYGGGGGGSSFISGHAGCLAIDRDSLEGNLKLKSGCNSESKNLDCSIHYSNYKFENTEMIDGLGYKWTTEVGEQTEMPSPNGGTEVGHTGNGYAKITLIK